MHKEYVLFTLVEAATSHSPERRYPVEFWTSESLPCKFFYGVTCNRLVTTNGSYRFLVHCIKDRDYTIEPGLIAPKSMSEWDLLDALRDWLNENAMLYREGEHRLGQWQRMASTSWS